MNDAILRSPIEDAVNRGVSRSWIARASGASKQTIHRLRGLGPDAAGRIEAGLYLALKESAGVDFTDFIKQGKRFKQKS